MTRATVDYGIDLGTTNSSIALAAGTGTEVIKNNVDADITPSAVYINRGGNLWVGQSARSKIGDERAEDDVFLEFKRRMGTGFDYNFRASGRRMRPEELSAEVLKSLRSDVTQKKGEEISAAVIAVPAAFELHQCEATKRAAELAGLQHVSLVQEPVAAALAYGYQKLNARAYWLVFDFGGGTFDAALIRAEDGMMVVANHGGDNFLGGSDIDWSIVEQFLAPRVAKEFNVPDFKRGAEAYKYDLVRLKAAAEAAKIDLSRKESTFIEATLRKVAGETVTFETQLTRLDVTTAARPVIEKAVDIANRVLAQKGLEPTAIERLIFVGGPTLAPYFRDIVRDRLGIPFDLTVDPLTVVARGAAIFASAQKLPKKPSLRTAGSEKSGVFPLELIYKPVGPDTEALVGGRVTPARGVASLSGYTVEIVNQQSKWRSGKVPLKENASFQMTVRAEKGSQNTFQIELRNATGTLCETEPSQFGYTVGLVLEEQTIIHNMGVATTDNKVALHFNRGQGLPAKYTKTYRTATELSQGQSGSVIKIPIIEGDRELADRNVLIGAVEIRSDKIKRDLPAGSEIEVTLNMDVSRLLTVVAYVPLLDEEFPAKIELGGKIRQPDLQILRQELTRETQRLMELKAAPPKLAEPTALKKLESLEASPAWRQLVQILSRDGADFDALLKADRELLDFKVQLDDIAAQIEWPTAIQAAENGLAELDRLVGLHGTSEEKTRARSLREQVRAIVAEENPDRLRKKIGEITDVHSSVLYRQPSFWIGYFDSLALHESKMREPARAAALLKDGRMHAAALDLVELKSVIYQLQDLLPAQTVEDARRGYGSGLLSSS
jgi:molecular chaperone DnaK